MRTKTTSSHLHHCDGNITRLFNYHWFIGGLQLWEREPSKGEVCSRPGRGRGGGGNGRCWGGTRQSLKLAHVLLLTRFFLRHRNCLYLHLCGKKKKREGTNFYVRALFILCFQQSYSALNFPSRYAKE